MDEGGVLMVGSAEWYTQKELVEKINTLNTRLDRTERLLVEYNGLRQMLNDAAKTVLALQTTQTACIASRQGANNTGRAVREWGGWIIAVAGFLAKIAGWW